MGRTPEDQTISIAQAGAFERTAKRDHLNPTLKDGQAFSKGYGRTTDGLPRERWASSPFGEYWLAYRVGLKNQRGS
jgi:hypothetical protein